MDDQVLVVELQRQPDAGMGVEPAHFIQVIGVDPVGQRRCQGIVQGWLAALLFPGPRIVRVLHRQTVAVRQVFDVGIVV